ncbi:MAG: hypothetical protein ACE5EA_04380 [Nitrospirota bacterium]
MNVYSYLKQLAGVGIFILTILGFIKDINASLTLNSTLSTVEQYSDNIRFQSDKRGDILTSVSPQLLLAYKTSNLILSGKYNGSLEFYLRDNSLNQYNQNASFDIDLPVISHITKNVKIGISEDIAYTPSLPPFYFDNETRDANEGIQIRRTDTFINQSGFNIAYTLSPVHTATLTYNNTITRFKGETAHDSVFHNAGIGWEYKMSRLAALTASYDTSITIYKGDEETASHGIEIGANYQMSKTFSSDAGIGITKISSEPIRLTFNSGLSKTYKSGISSLRYTRAIGRGGGLVASNTLSQRVIGRIEQHLSTTLSIYLRGAYSKNISIPGGNLNISSFEGGTGINISLKQWLNCSLSYSYLTQNSRGSVGEDTNRNMVILSITTSAKPWRIM